MMTSVTIGTSLFSPHEAVQQLRDAARNYNQNESLRTLIGDIRHFEQRYNLSTVEFYPRYIAGLIGDECDYILWASMYEAYVELTQPHLIN